MTRQGSIKPQSADSALQKAEIRRNIKYFRLLFTPQEIARLEALPTDKFLVVVKRRLVMLATYLIMCPNASSRDRLFLLDLLKRYNRHDSH